MTPEEIEDVYLSAKHLVEQVQKWDAAWLEAEAEEKAWWDTNGWDYSFSTGFVMGVIGRVKAKTGLSDRTPEDSGYGLEHFAAALVALKEGAK